MLRVIAGLERIDAGTIEMDGVVVNDMPPCQPRGGDGLSSYALYPGTDLALNEDR